MGRYFDQQNPLGQVRKEQRDFSSGRFERIRAVNEVFAGLRRQIAADRPRGRFFGIRRTHHRSHDREDVLGSFEHTDEDGARGDELHQSRKKRFAVVFGVVRTGRRLVKRAQRPRREAQTPTFEASQDLTKETARDGVGFHDNQSAVHGEKAYFALRAVT